MIRFPTLKFQHGNVTGVHLQFRPSRLLVLCPLDKVIPPLKLNPLLIILGWTIMTIDAWRPG